VRTFVLSSRDADDGYSDRDTSYLHHPFLDPADYQRALAFLAPPTPRRRPIVLPPRRHIRYELTAIDLGAHAGWDECGFTDVERDMWIEHGLSRYDAHIAEQCHRLGLPAAALLLRFDAPRRRTSSRRRVSRGCPRAAPRAVGIAAGVADDDA